MNKIKKKLLKVFEKNKTEAYVLLLGFFFSVWLMFSTFSYEDGTMQIATKAWSDFASHIPLIRYFSFGSIFPLEYPLFPGEPIRYHFLFYLFVGLLEKVGLRIDYALNIPSLIGFTGLIFMIYLFAKLLFKSKAVGILSIILFLFNGTLSFLYFLENHSLLSEDFISSIIENTTFPSFAPYYGKGIVSAFWNLNIYTNQRHLAISYALAFFVIYFFLRKMLNKKNVNIRHAIILGCVLGISFLLNMAVFAMSVVVMFILFLFFRKKEIMIFLFSASLIGGFFYFYFLPKSTISTFGFYPGYLINDLNLYSFFYYWIYNLGLHFVFIPIGFLLAPKNVKKIFIAFFSLFVLANFFRFSSEIAANHKFINFFMIFGVMLTAYFMVWLWEKRSSLKPLVAVFIFLLTFSGIIDFFPIYNDSKIHLPDYPINENISWIIQNTPSNSIFLNSEYIYDQPSLAGRKIFLGWPYFSWSQGYNTQFRDELRKELFMTSDINWLCLKAKEYKINYIEQTATSDLKLNPNITSLIDKVYENNGYRIYSLRKICNLYE